MRKNLLLLGLASLTLVAGMGCSGGSDPDASAKTQEQSSRLQQIRNSSQGDWNKVTAADKDYLIKEVAHGSEATAKIVLGGPPKKK